MAALDVNDWTLTLDSRWIVAGKRYARGTLALAGTDTYPTGGVPLPAFGAFGFPRQIDDIQLSGQTGAPTSGYVASWDRTNGKLQLFGQTPTAAGAGQLPLDEMDTAEVPGPRTFTFLAVGS